MTVSSVWLKHRPVARAIARDYGIPGLERQDVEQEALIGLWVAAREWRPDGGASFKTFAELVIKRRLATVLKLALRLKHEPLNNSVRVVAVDDHGLLEVAAVDAHGRDTDEVERIVIGRERLAEMVAAVKTLTPLELDALRTVANGVPYAGNRRMDNAVQRVRQKLNAEAPG